MRSFPRLSVIFVGSLALLAMLPAAFGTRPAAVRAAPAAAAVGDEYWDHRFSPSFDDNTSQTNPIATAMVVFRGDLYVSGKNFNGGALRTTGTMTQVK